MCVMLHSISMLNHDSPPRGGGAMSFTECASLIAIWRCYISSVCLSLEFFEIERNELFFKISLRSLLFHLRERKCMIVVDMMLALILPSTIPLPQLAHSINKEKSLMWKQQF